MLEKVDQLSCGGLIPPVIQLPENVLNCQAQMFFVDTVTEQLQERRLGGNDQRNLASLASSIF
jgi:hypothetical protein